MQGIRLILTVLWLVLYNSASGAAHISARHAWIRLLPGNLPAAGYLELTNAGADSVQLVAMQSAYFGSIELHESSEQSGVARMRRVDSLDIPAGRTVRLKPRGYHLMLFRPVGTLKPGDRVTVMLEFSDASHLAVKFLLRDASGQ